MLKYTLWYIYSLISKLVINPDEHLESQSLRHTLAETSRLACLTDMLYSRDTAARETTALVSFWGVISFKSAADNFNESYF